MGIIKAAAGAVGGALADQWLETIEPAKMDNSVATHTELWFGKMTAKLQRRRTEDVISTVPSSMFRRMYSCFTVDGGRSYQQRMNPDTGR